MLHTGPLKFLRFFFPHSSHTTHRWWWWMMEHDHIWRPIIHSLRWFKKRNLSKTSFLRIPAVHGFVQTDKAIILRTWVAEKFGLSWNTELTLFHCKTQKRSRATVQLSLGLPCNPLFIPLYITSGQPSSGLCWIMESTEAKVRTALNLESSPWTRLLCAQITAYNAARCAYEEEDEDCWINTSQHTVKR